MLAKVVEWQLEYPDGTKDDCVSWLKTEYKMDKFCDVDSSRSERSRRRARTNEDGPATKSKKPKR